MQWEFAILDRDGTETIIEQPEGWDATKITIKRDLILHGIFFDYQGNDFTFRGTKPPEEGAFTPAYTPPYHKGGPGAAYGVIRDEYRNFGVQGNLVLIIRQDCGYGYEELYRGKLVFSQYKEHCGDDCWCKIPMEIIGDVMKLKNRWDQEVDLQSLISFDGRGNLEYYENLGKEISLPGKGILLQNKASLSESKELLVKLSDIGYLFPPSPAETRYAWFNLTVPFNDISLSEFGNFAPGSDINNVFIRYGTYNAEVLPEQGYIFEGTNPNSHTAPVPPPYYHSVYFDWASSPPLMYFNPDSPNNLDFVRSFNLHVSFDYVIDVKSCYFMALHHAIVKRRLDGSIEVLDNDIHYNIRPSETGDWIPDSQHAVSYDKSLSGVRLEKGEYLFVVIAGVIRFWTGSLDTEDAFKITINSAKYESETISYSEPSNVKMFLVNESLSRVAEAITDGNIRVYSDYFGRKDSKPYPVAGDGCGSLAALTKGLYLRGVDQKDDQPINFSLSMKNLWDGLNPIHNIGCGIESDDRRQGYNRLRVEPWRYFYQFDTIMECSGVYEINREVVENEHYSTFVFGYEKWEAEAFNGLDEFLTKRKYRTTLSELQNELSQLSKMVASGYAIEVTKRIGNTDSKDWRYDNDTFIICLSRMPKFHVEFYGGFNTIRISYVGPAAVFQVAQIEIRGSKFNDGLYNRIGVMAIGPNFILMTLSGGVLTDEESHNVTFPGLSFSGFFPEQGGIDSPSSLVDPDTILNFRISPIRNAMRWADRIFPSYRNVDEDSKLIFTDSEGNCFARGGLSGECAVEQGPIAENETIDLSKFRDANTAIPIRRPERISFQQPMSLREFKSILANPYGVIALVDSCTTDAGWIDQIDYFPNDGMATFKIIPAYPDGKYLLTPGVFDNSFADQMV